MHQGRKIVLLGKEENVQSVSWREFLSELHIDNIQSNANRAVPILSWISC